MLKVFLSRGKEIPLLRSHPWVFSGAVDRIEGAGDAGSEAEIYASNGRFLGKGLFHPKTTIALRCLSHENVSLDHDFFRFVLKESIALREIFPPADFNAYRLVNGEGDFLPGLVVDRYSDFLVCQFLTAGMDQRKEMIADCLWEIAKPRGIYERSGGSVRRVEGLPERSGCLRGEDPPEFLPILEAGLEFLVNLREGQKTGFYLDLRDARILVRRWSRNREVLNCYAYTGGFSVAAAIGEAASVTSLESSEPAVKLAGVNWELNKLEKERGDLICMDVLNYLKNNGKRFDLVILDPPPFARHRKDQERAAKMYRDLNALAFERLKSGGLLLSLCCSQHVGRDLFEKLVLEAAIEAGRRVRVLSRLGHPLDHPVSLHHPEGEYLKGLLLMSH